MVSALLHFDGDVGVVLEVSGQPDGGEVPPAELLHDDISVHQHFTGVSRPYPIWTVW